MSSGPCRAPGRGVIVGSRHPPAAAAAAIALALAACASGAVGSAPLSSGAASVTTATLAAGAHALTASYGGSSAHAGSTSPAIVSALDEGGCRPGVNLDENLNDPPGELGESVGGSGGYGRFYCFVVR